MKSMLCAMYIGVMIFLGAYWWVLLDIRKYLKGIEKTLREMMEE